MKPRVRPEDIITLEKLAEEMGVSADTIKRWISKSMPVIRIDKFVRVYRPDVLRWLINDNTEKAQSGVNDRS